MANSNIAPTPLQSAIAGATAGGLESLCTYPTEYLKTTKQLLDAQAQRQGPIRILVDRVRAHGPTVLYTGCGVYCTALALTQAVRYSTFDIIKNKLPKNAKTGKPSTTSNMLAGVTAGVTEALTIVTPGENIKTKVIDDRNGARQYKNSFHVMRAILAKSGPRGFFEGATPVIMKQGSNAMIRFTTYNAIMNVIQPRMAGSRWSGTASFISGIGAGITDVFLTMPLDVVKTKLQSLEGRARYRSTWHCFSDTLQRGGVRAFWEGTTPRLARMSVAGGLSFGIYQHVVGLLQQADGQKQEVAAL